MGSLLWSYRIIKKVLIALIFGILDRSDEPWEGIFIIELAKSGLLAGIAICRSLLVRYLLY